MRLLDPMVDAHDRLRVSLTRLRERATGLPRSDWLQAPLERWLSDASAVQFHLAAPGDRPLLVAIMGGTGAGKSTLLNRLAQTDISAESFRRTFTAGSVALCRDAGHVPEGWLGLPHVTAAPHELPIRGQGGKLMVVVAGNLPVVLVDTPDLDGDQPAHHAEADRAFRWAEAAIFVVTPEKYQMTELLGYYRLAHRYALPALFVLNKCEETAVLEDYRAELAQREWEAARVFGVPRDDAAWEPPAGMGLVDLRGTLSSLKRTDGDARDAAIRRRCTDLAGRFRDQVLAPLRETRRHTEPLVSSLRLMWTPLSAVDVSAVTRQLQRRMQERSVLYLMGPERVLERITTLPSLIARLPRTFWERARGEEPLAPAERQQAGRKVPDFQQLLADQLTMVQSQIDDVLRGDPIASRAMEREPERYAATRVDPATAGAIVADELSELKRWLETYWNAAPRDTRVLQKLLKYLPGGRSVTKWSEAAPYLLAIIVAAHGAVFGPIDLIIIGGWSLATWLGERLSNEVLARTREANRRISDRFDALVREQVERVCSWLDTMAPPAATLDELEQLTQPLG